MSLIIKQLFDNRQGVIATMHKKEQVISPILEQELGLKLIVPKEFNSDQFGTFTNEIPRVGDQLQAARKKVQTALEETGLSIGVASEGSFGPHPSMPFVPYNRELVLLIDKELNLEIVGYVSNANTNHSQKEVRTFEEAYAFSTSIGFPEHGVILKSVTTNEVKKGIINKTNLQQAFFHLQKEAKKSLRSLITGSYKTIIVQSDMRAMYNPTRMKNIELATLDLITKIKTLCSECGTPGFEVVDVQKGLTCEYCHFPTEQPLAYIYECKKCMYKEVKRYPNGIKHADPSQCHICNP